MLSSWDHELEVYNETFNLIANNQHQSLRKLRFKNHEYIDIGDPPQYSPIRPQLLPVSLEDIAVSDLSFNDDRLWPLTLIALNRTTLRHLRLGDESSCAAEWASNEDYGHSHKSAHVPHDSFQKPMHLIDNQDLTPKLHLRTLEICGIDMCKVLQGHIGLEFSLESLTKLRLESCPDLVEAMEQFTTDTPDAAKALNAPMLTSLFVRHEFDSQSQDDDFHNVLEKFLNALPGLTELEVLVIGIPSCYLGSIFKVHGGTLKRFIWDYQDKPRTTFADDDSTFPRIANDLEVISDACPNLVSLGLRLDWADITLYQTEVLP